MSWRCAGLFSFPILCLYVASFFLTAWEDNNGTYLGYETLGNSFDRLGRSNDFLTPMLVLLPNLIVSTGIVLLAVPKTWARIVASVLGFLALVISAQLMVCVGVLSVISNIVTALFGANSGPGQVREGFFVWIGSMFLLLLVGMISAIVSGTRAEPDRSDDRRRLPRNDDDDRRDSRDRRRTRHDYEDDDFNRRRRSEGERWRRDQD